MLSGKVGRELFAARSGADGRFRIQGLPSGAGVNLAARKQGMAMREPTFDPSSLDTTPCRAGQQDAKVVMEPGGEIRGRVIVDKTGRPLAGVKLWRRRSHAVFSFDDGWEPVASGPDGAFKFAEVASGSYQIGAVFDPLSTSAPEWVSEAVEVSVQAGQAASETKTNRCDLAFVLKAANLTLAGQLVDAQAQPLAGVRLQVDGESQPYRSTQTDANGRFTFERLCAGQVRIGGICEGSFINAPATAGDTNVLIRVVTKKGN